VASLPSRTSSPPPCKRIKRSATNECGGDENYDSSSSDNSDSDHQQSTTTVFVDPIVAVARKTLHEEDRKPAAQESPIQVDDENEHDHDDDTTQMAVDRLSALNTDLLCKITSFLNPAGLLLHLGGTNKYYQTACRQDAAGWTRLCHDTWRHKVHVLPAARREPNHRRAYQMALLDARDRYWVLPEELCYDTPNQTVWSFRFKESAGTDWTNTDPWYRGRPCRQLAFLRDGRVREVVQTNNDTDTDTTAPTTTTLVDPPLRMTWRFLTRPMDLPHRPQRGAYVRLTVGGRDVPTYKCRRSPTHNWGFVLESCWGVYASFPLPPRGATNALQDDALRLTNEIQWREAFLYNVGARTLPEGDLATDEFDRAWQGQFGL